MTDNLIQTDKTPGDCWVGYEPPVDKNFPWWNGHAFFVWDNGGQRWVQLVKPLKPFLTYVAGPYTATGPDEAKINQERYFKLTVAAAMLCHCKKWNAFSPITQNHPMRDIIGLPGDWAYWQRIDTDYISASERLVIVTLDGWEQSTGVTAESKLAKEMGVPIWHMTEPEKNDVGVWGAWLTDNHSGEYLSYYDERVK